MHFWKEQTRDDLLGAYCCRNIVHFQLRDTKQSCTAAETRTNADATRSVMALGRRDGVLSRLATAEAEASAFTFFENLCIRADQLYHMYMI